MEPPMSQTPERDAESLLRPAPNLLPHNLRLTIEALRLFLRLHGHATRISLPASLHSIGMSTMGTSIRRRSPPSKHSSLPRKRRTPNSQTQPLPPTGRITTAHWAHQRRTLW